MIARFSPTAIKYNSKALNIGQNQMGSVRRNFFGKTGTLLAYTELRHETSIAGIFRKFLSSCSKMRLL